MVFLNKNNLLFVNKHHSFYFNITSKNCLKFNSLLNFLKVLFIILLISNRDFS